MRSFLLHCTTALALTWAAHAHATPADFAAQLPSNDARHVVDWVMASQDHTGLPFAIVDKKAARLYVFDADGRLQGVSAALLGLAPGDHGDPNLNQRDLSRLARHERTTPAGRFIAQPGRNLQGEPVVWVDYGAALAIHRLRPAPAHERRPARLESATAADNRISLGCVVVPVDFYVNTVEPLLGRGRSVVYILPETRPADEMFGWD
jgi:hypothetical protein